MTLSRAGGPARYALLCWFLENRGSLGALGPLFLQQLNRRYVLRAARLTQRGIACFVDRVHIVAQFESQFRGGQGLLIVRRTRERWDCVPSRVLRFCPGRRS